MSNIIDLLEKIGQDARLRHASSDDMDQVLTRAEIDPEVQAAILAKDQSRLEDLLAASNVCLALIPSIECLMLIGTNTDEDDRDQRQCA
ncbi:hypothetical protein [Rhodanobacter lindaniclasticus]|uniref:Uncharacterized protein n=1 Tax=Rhodanobacter lindaniclasticus TaxID=75310 RepID=A0A4V3UTB7_9GAMM|nr:hypothetical protein [Rhodanobacter lindaniclasticus]THD10021.1 hypothetical protein B1991_00920 [Rhodanobacter lindaniclasticus]